MRKLTREELYSLEAYAEFRPEIRAKVMAHKRRRQVPVGPNATLHFEDRLTIQYQVQEMLRIERIFEIGGIEEELAAYNPLIPDGANWKATLMIEFDDETERRRRLAELKGIETTVWMQVGTHPPTFGIANEDLERTNEEKTSSVHFLRFELSPAMVEAAKEGAPLAMGIEHDGYRHVAASVQEPVRAALVADLD